MDDDMRISVNNNLDLSEEDNDLDDDFDLNQEELILQWTYDLDLS